MVALRTPKPVPKINNFYLRMRDNYQLETANFEQTNSNTGLIFNAERRC